VVKGVYTPLTTGRRSYVPDGYRVLDWLTAQARRSTVFQLHEQDSAGQHDRNGIRSNERRISGKQAVQEPKNEAEHHDEEHSKRNVLGGAGSPDLQGIAGHRRGWCTLRQQTLSA